MDEKLKAFVGTVLERPALWPTYDLRVLAFRIGGRWRNLSAHGYLRSEPASEVPRLRHLPRGKNIRGWQLVSSVRKGNAFRKLMASLHTGVVDVGDERILFQSGDVDNGRGKPYTTQHLSLHTEVGRYPHMQVGWPGYSLLLSGEDNETDYAQRVPSGWAGLEKALRSPVKPYQDLMAVSLYMASRKGWYSSGHNVLVDWFAPLAVRIDADRTDLRGGLLRFRINAGATAALEHATLRVYGESRPADSEQSKPLLKRLALEDLPAIRAGQDLFVSGELRIRSHGRLTLSLEIASEVVQTIEVEDFLAAGRNARAAVYEVVDAGKSRLKEALFPEGEKARNHFEGAVARLLALVGFEVDRWSENPRLGDGVDVVAYLPQVQTCFAIECTTGSLNPDGKIGKLVARLGKIRRAVPELDVQGVLLTCVREDDLSRDDIRDAAAAGLLLVHKEHLERLLGVSDRSLSTSELLAFMQSCVPRIRQGRAFPSS